MTYSFNVISDVHLQPRRTDVARKPSEFAIEQAYGRGAADGQRLPRSTFFGLSKASKEELAANRRGLNDRYREEERERRRKERAEEREAEREVRREAAREKHEREQQDAEFARSVARAEEYRRRHPEAHEKGRSDSVNVNGSQHGEITALQVKLETAERRASAAAAESAQQRAELKSLQARLQTAEQLLERAMETLGDFEAMVAHKTREVAVANAELGTLREQLAKVVSERDQSRKKERWVREITNFDALPVAPPGRQFTYMPAEFVSEIDYPDDPRLRIH